MTKKILYVSPIWTNLGPYELSSKFESGMPAFTEPLKALMAKGIAPRLLWIDDSSSPKLRDPELAAQRRIIISGGSRIDLALSFLRIFGRVFLEITRYKPDVVFCHGAISAGALCAALLLRKRTVVRVYGTNKYLGELNRLGNLRFSLKYPLVFLLFKLPSAAMIATDDGSGADKIFERIGTSKEFFFLKNGAPRLVSNLMPGGNRLLCVGRVERKKNQLAAVDFFNAVAKFDTESKLLFIGEVSDPEYLEELTQKIKLSEYSSRIEIIGSSTKQQLYEYYFNSEAILSFQQNSNFGNVAIESMSTGCLFVTFREESFESLSLPAGSAAALLGDSISELAKAYTALSDREKKNIQHQARSAMRRLLDLWELRATKEVDILLRDFDV